MSLAPLNLWARLPIFRARNFHKFTKCRGARPVRRLKDMCASSKRLPRPVPGTPVAGTILNIQLIAALRVVCRTDRGRARASRKLLSISMGRIERRMELSSVTCASTASHSYGACRWLRGCRERRRTVGEGQRPTRQTRGAGGC